MHTVKMHDAKTNLSRLIARVEAGEEVVIMRGTIPVARLVPIPQQPAERQPGRLAGKIRLDDSFFEALPEGELVAWEGE
jgi:prevent-host-death family protein